MMLSGTMAIGAVLLGRVLTLAEAERTALEHQPQLAQARAQTEAAAARADVALSALLPELAVAAVYERATYNRPFTPTKRNRPEISAETFNNYDFAVAAKQLVWDFGQTTNRWGAAREQHTAQDQTETAVRLQVLLNVREAFFRARALGALVNVARETLANLQRHLAQIEGFVRVGNRPQIDLVQARSDVARARVALINAQNGYAVGRAALNQAMGMPASTDYDVADDGFAPVPGEDQPVDQLVQQALAARPEVAAYNAQMRAQQLTIDSERGAYFPSLSVGGYFNERGIDITDLRWNYGALVTLAWPLFQGGKTRATVREARALLASLSAQAESLRQQVAVSVQTAQLAVRAAREAVTAAEESVTLANERLRMAEGRYAAGVGGIIELADAQLGQTTAAAQKVQADFSLAAARAELVQALGAGQ